MTTLSSQVRANCWALAEAAGHDGWGRMQALLSSYVWDHTQVRDLLAPLAGQWLTCPPEDLVGPGIAIDETAALKKVSAPSGSVPSTPAAPARWRTA